MHCEYLKIMQCTIIDPEEKSACIINSVTYPELSTTTGNNMNDQHAFLSAQMSSIVDASLQTQKMCSTVTGHGMQ